MELIKLGKTEKRYLEPLKALYFDAFPEVERKPFPYMVELCASGKMEMLAVVENGEFIGLDINMLAENAAILDYFAISPEKRSGGYGSRALRLILDRFQGQKLIFEIETQDPSAENAVDRKRRKDFYLRNGVKETGVFANVYHTDFELLTQDGKLTFGLYLEALRSVLGEEGVTLLNPTQLFL